MDHKVENVSLRNKITVERVFKKIVKFNYLAFESIFWKILRRHYVNEEYLRVY